MYIYDCLRHFVTLEEDEDDEEGDESKMKHFIAKKHYYCKNWLLYLQIIHLISQPKHMLLVLNRTVSIRRVFEQLKHMFKLKVKRIIIFSTHTF